MCEQASIHSSCIRSWSIFAHIPYLACEFLSRFLSHYTNCQEQRKYRLKCIPRTPPPPHVRSCFYLPWVMRTGLDRSRQSRLILDVRVQVQAGEGGVGFLSTCCFVSVCASMCVMNVMAACVSAVDDEAVGFLRAGACEQPTNSGFGSRGQQRTCPFIATSGCPYHIMAGYNAQSALVGFSLGTCCPVVWVHCQVPRRSFRHNK